jgi:hypothetical protein
MEQPGERGARVGWFGFLACLSLAVAIVAALYWTVSMLTKKG